MKKITSIALLLIFSLSLFFVNVPKAAENEYYTYLEGLPRNITKCYESKSVRKIHYKKVKNGVDAGDISINAVPALRGKDHCVMYFVAKIKSKNIKSVKSYHTGANKVTYNEDGSVHYYNNKDGALTSIEKGKTCFILLDCGDSIPKGTKLKFVIKKKGVNKKKTVVIELSEEECESLNAMFNGYRAKYDYIYRLKHNITD